MRKALHFAALALALLCNAAPAHAGLQNPTLPGAGGQWNGVSRTVDLATTGDKGVINVPAYITRYRVVGAGVVGCSATPVLAQVAIYSAASASGTNIVAAGTITAATGTTVVVPLTVASANTALTSATIYPRVTVANSTALTCDVYVIIEDWT